MKRHELDDGTVLTIQTPVGPPGTQAAAVAVLFDGRPMMNAGVAGTLLTLQDEAIIPPLMLVAVESIEGSTPRGPTRCASLTNPGILERFVRSLEGFFEREFDTLPSRARRLVLGHSLGGNAALYVACHWPHLFGGVVTGSAALSWPGDDDQLAGRRVVEDVLTSPGVRFWMQAGSEEDADLLAANRDLWQRADEAGLDLVHREFHGGHDLAAFKVGLAVGMPHLLSGPALS